MRQTIQHYRTTGSTEPTPSDLMDGEIAVSFGSDKPRLWTRLTDGTNAEYVPKSYIDDKLSGNTYTLVLDDDGVLSCIKNTTDEGFIINSDGSLDLS